MLVHYTDYHEKWKVQVVTIRGWWKIICAKLNNAYQNVILVHNKDGDAQLERILLNPVALP